MDAHPFLFLLPNKDSIIHGHVLLLYVRSQQQSWENDLEADCERDQSGEYIEIERWRDDERR